MVFYGIYICQMVLHMKIMLNSLLVLFVSSAPSIPDTQTNEQMVYFATDHQMWALDVEAFTYTPVVSLNPTDSVLGRFIVTQDPTQIYFIEHTQAETDDTLNIYDPQTDTIERIYSHPHLSAMTSPHHEMMFLSLIDMEHPERSSVCLLSLRSKACDTVDIPRSFGSLYWLEDRAFLMIENDGSLESDAIRVYQLPSSEEDRLELVSETFLEGFRSVYPTAMKGTSVYFINYDALSDEKILYSLDTQTFELTERTDVKISDVPARVIAIRISPDGKYLAYKIMLDLYVVDLSSGQTVSQIPDVYMFQWVSNETLVASRSGSRAELYELSLINVVENVTSERLPIAEETVSVWFSKSL